MKNVYHFFSADEQNNLITLVDSENNKTTYNMIAGVGVSSGYYFILQPLVLLDGMTDSDALVMRVSVDNEVMTLQVVADELIINEVWCEYYKLAKEENK